jgi:hypothetical protein
MLIQRQAAVVLNGISGCCEVGPCDAHLSRDRLCLRCVALPYSHRLCANAFSGCAFFIAGRSRHRRNKASTSEMKSHG